MSALLRKHRTTVAGDEDADLENQLIDEMDSMPDTTADEAPARTTDPRWDKLKDLTEN